jgi:hypothetical protein
VSKTITVKSGPSRKARVELGGPAFFTERMNVFAVGLVPAVSVELAEMCRRRWVFIAMSVDVDDVRPLALCMVDDCDKLWSDRSAHVDWIEVMSCERRRGLATELLEGVRKHIGRELIVVGATEEGNGLERAWKGRMRGERRKGRAA